MNKEAINRAADWLEANPDKHISASYAAGADGNYLFPLDPRAECFCAIGRIAKECEESPFVRAEGEKNIGTPENPDVRKWMLHIAGLDGGQFNQIVILNDELNERHDEGNVFKPLWRGNPAVIPLLRKLAA